MTNIKIKQLYRDYFQKSRVFLYPALGIRKSTTLEIQQGKSITPVQTYVSWDNKIHIKEKKLICLYKMRDDPEYKEFERTKLKGNKMFEKLIRTEEEPPRGVYIFNFNQYDKDWDLFIKGRYSKMSTDLKRKIKEFFRTTPSNPGGGNYVYVESFLHPEKYWPLYSELLGVSVDALREVGELTDPPDMEKEALKIAIGNLNKIIK